MHAELGGDVLERERPDGFPASRKKGLLVHDNGLRDAQDRLKALGDVADQPSRLLELAVQRTVGAGARAAERLGVELIDPQARNHGVIEHRRPPRARLAHDHVRYREIRSRNVPCAAGAWIESEHERVGSAQHLDIAMQRLAQPRHIACREHGQVPLAQRASYPDQFGIPRLGKVHRIRIGELQIQALREIPCTDTRWIERMQQVERRAKVLRLDTERGINPAGDLLDRRRKHAIVIELVDQHLDQRRVARGKAGCRELRQQVLAQRGLAHGLRPCVALVIARGARFTGIFRAIALELAIRFRLVAIRRRGFRKLLGRRVGVAWRVRSRPVRGCRHWCR